jgi:hypothetical protein
VKIDWREIFGYSLMGIAVMGMVFAVWFLKWNAKANEERYRNARSPVRFTSIAGTSLIGYKFGSWEDTLGNVGYLYHIGKTYERSKANP